MVCLFSNAFRLQSFFKYLIKIILVWEIIMIDKFWFNGKSSSELVDIALWKKGLKLVVQIASCHVMEFFWKVNGVLLFKKRICDF